jgi:hypothetical protein
MTAHTESHAPETAHGHTDDGTDPKLQIAAALKFEPIEVQDFEIADKQAGQMMGKLLGALFCVLVVLMTGVNLWMIGRDATGKDPQNLTFGPTQHAPEHH